jgi:hypothetical protein
MKNKFIKIILIFSVFALILSCDDNNDFTGDSVLSATSPILSVNLSFENSQTLIEQEKQYAFTVALSEAQIVDVVVKLEQISGTATDGEDFTIPHTVTIPKGSLSASDVITIHADELIEDTETATIQIGLGTEANVSSVSSETVTFNIGNVTSGDVVIDLTWASSATITDNEGNAIAAEDLANLEILVTNTTIPTSQTFLSVDAAAGFESFVFSESFPDGEYFLVAQFFSAADYGGVFADLDLTLEFNQIGKINNEKVTIAAGLNTGNASCQASIIAKLIKNGADYTIETVGVPNNAGIPADGTFVGDYTVATTSEGQFGPAFDGTVTLVDEGNDVRSFVGDWNGFGIDQTWEFEFNPICGTVTFVDNQDTGLGCGGPGIIHGSSPNASVIPDPTDDSSFTITYRENTSSGCGGEPTDVTITFTKI